MKNLLLLCSLFSCILLNAANITSTAGGGNWNVPATWVGGVVPGIADNATIAGPVTVNVVTSVNNVTINASQTLTVSATFGVYGVLTNNGSLAGTKDIGIHANGIVLT